MREAKVVWTEVAVRDLEEILTFISLDSPDNARAVVSRLRESVQKLNAFPARGRVVPEFLDVGIQAWRELVVQPYRIVYRIEDQRIFIELIFDSRRDAESVLFDRLVRG